MHDDVPADTDVPDARTGEGRPMPEPVQRGTQASVAALRRLGRRLPRG